MSTNSLPLNLPESAFSGFATATARVERNTSGMVQVFVYLQILDVLTTLLGFRVGASEASPVVRVFLQAGPITGLLLSKVIALALCGICVYFNKRRLIRWANYWYSGLAVWNLFIILAVLRLK